MCERILCLAEDQSRALEARDGEPGYRQLTRPRPDESHAAAETSASTLGRCETMLDEDAVSHQDAVIDQAVNAGSEVHLPVPALPRHLNPEFPPDAEILQGPGPTAQRVQRDQEEEAEERRQHREWEE